MVPAPRFTRHFTTNLPEDHEVTVLENVGHVPMFEAPERVTEVITNFLDQCIMPTGAIKPSAG